MRPTKTETLKWFGHVSWKTGFYILRSVILLYIFVSICNSAIVQEIFK